MNPADIDWTERTFDASDVLLHVVRSGGPTAFFLSATDTLTDAELAAQHPGTRLIARALIAADPTWIRHVGGWSRPDRG